MKPPAVLALALACASIGCGLLVGIGDLPAPDGGGPGNVDAPDVVGDDRASDAGDEGSVARDDAYADTSVSEADGRPSDVVPRDRVALDQLAEDVRRDRGVEDASDGAAPDRRSPLDARAEVVDKASCPLVPVDAARGCEDCLQTQCCGELGACEAVDDAALEDTGQSSCVQQTNASLTCIAALGGLLGSCAPVNPQGSSGQTEASALLACLDQSCANDCQGIVALPGI